MNWNPEVRDWQLHNHVDNKSCLTSEVRCHYPGGDRLGVKTTTLREIQFAFALLGGVLTDSLGWLPRSYESQLSQDQRDILAVSTLKPLSRFVYRLQNTLEHFVAWYPEISPLVEKLKPQFNLFTINYLNASLASPGNQFAILSELPKFKEGLDTMRTVLFSDAYFQAYIGSPRTWPIALPATSPASCLILFGSNKPIE